jgi:hypothetical protein
MFVLPRIYAVMRSSFRELDSANIKILELEKEIKYKLNNDIKFPEFLKTELYKKKIIDNIGSLLNYRSSQNIASNPSKDF